MSNNLVRGAFMNNFGTAKKSNKSMYNTYQRCRAADVIPGGMNMRTCDGRMYAVDPRLEMDPIRLTIRDLVQVLKASPARKDVSRVATKLGFDFTGSIDQTKAMICDALESHNILEPVLLGSKGAKRNANQLPMNNANNANRVPGTNNNGGQRGSGNQVPGNGGNAGNSGSGLPPKVSFNPHITLNSANKKNRNKYGNKLAPEENLGNLKPSGIRGDPKEALLRNIKNQMSNISRQV
jgi:hypothetical protein